MKDYRIAVDSCTEMNEKMRSDPHVVKVPLTLRLGNTEVVDDDSFDQASFLKMIAESPDGPSSACPSPQAFMDAFGSDDCDAYAITLSAELSGSYNSAMQAKKMLQEDMPRKNIHVFNSRSAAAGQSLVLMKLQECLAAGMPFKDVVVEVELYIREQTTLFVLETLEVFRKNGRLSNLKAAVVEVLNLKPVMGSTPAGTIKQVGKGRGMKKALTVLVDHIGETAIRSKEKALAIVHCNCMNRARWLKHEIEQRYDFKKIVILEAGGVSTTYACDGGIIVAY